MRYLIIAALALCGSFIIATGARAATDTEVWYATDSLLKATGETWQSATRFQAGKRLTKDGMDCVIKPGYTAWKCVRDSLEQSGKAIIAATPQTTTVPTRQAQTVPAPNVGPAPAPLVKAQPPPLPAAEPERRARLVRGTSPNGPLYAVVVEPVLSSKRPVYGKNLAITQSANVQEERQMTDAQRLIIRITGIPAAILVTVGFVMWCKRLRPIPAKYPIEPPLQPAPTPDVSPLHSTIRWDKQFFDTDGIQKQTAPPMSA